MYYNHHLFPPKKWKSVLDIKRCTKCSENLIGDEFHYLFICSHPEIVNLRVRYIPNYYLRNSNAKKNGWHVVSLSYRVIDKFITFSDCFHNVISVPCVFFSIFNLVHNECVEYIYVCFYLCMYICLLMLHLVPELN